MNSNLKFTILLLFFINILAGSIYFIVQKSYKLNYNNLSNKTIDFHKKKILTFNLNEKVNSIGNILLSIAIEPFMNEVKIEFKKNKIKALNKEIISILDVLKYGGNIKQEILINKISNSNNNTLNLTFAPEQKSIYIDDIRAYLEILNKYINKTFEVCKNRIDLIYYLKLIPSLINRGKENINNYLMLNNNRINEIEKEKKKLLKRFKYFEIVILLFTVVANGIIIYFIYKNLEIVNEELKNRLYYDSLTSLKNRNLLKEELKENGMLVVIDIDKFAIYNELYGNKIGDEILIELSKIFTSFEHLSKENVYRIGSDEFAFYFDSDFNIEEFLGKLLKKLKNTILKINSIKFENLTFKAGISTVPNYLDNALIALMQAKKRNKFFYIFSKEDMQQELKKIEDALYWTKKIEKAIEKKLIIPLFQPIVDKNKDIIKYEALMRLKDKDKLIPPFFLDIALKNNQYYDLLKIMFTKIIDIIAQKQLYLSFNVSYLDLVDDEIFEFLKKEVSRLKSPELLTLEILENEEIVDYEEINKRILYFKNLGINLAIDDFGSGYSNYKHILELNVNFLKIDGSLIKNLLEDKNSFYVVESIVSFAKKMNIKTIAEFVENEKIFNLLKEIGVDYFQGYYFSKPVML